MGEAVGKEEGIFEVKKLEPVLVPPASKTNDGLYFLSNLDLYQNIILTTIYCYKSDTTRSNSTACEVIKQALAEVLVHYYPFAWRIAMNHSDGKLVIDCTREGVPFVEAVADCDLEVLGGTAKSSNFKMLGMLVHTFPRSKTNLEVPLLTAQVTKFKCGGFVLGLATNHCMADGISALEFANSWSEIARGSPITVLPFLDRTIMKSRQSLKIEFPHNEFYEIKDVPKSILESKDDELIPKSFCIKEKMLAHLRSSAMEDGEVVKCSNFTVVAAHTWRVMTESLKMEDGQLTKLIFAVDVRSKFNPLLPKGYFGNAICHPCCLCSAGELRRKPLSFAIKLVQEAIKSMTEEYGRSAIDCYEEKRAYPLESSTLFISSWTRLGFFDSDFGWGKPTHTTLANPGPNLCFIVPQSEENKDLNILIVMAASVMKAFEEVIQI